MRVSRIVSMRVVMDFDWCRLRDMERAIFFVMG